MLDLCQRLPDLTLSFRSSVFSMLGNQCPRYSSRRLGYAFCPSCLADQPLIQRVMGMERVLASSRCADSSQASGGTVRRAASLIR